MRKNVLFLSAYSINLLEFYHEYRSLIGYVKRSHSWLRYSLSILFYVVDCVKSSSVDVAKMGPPLCVFEDKLRSIFDRLVELVDLY